MYGVHNYVDAVTARTYAFRNYDTTNIAVTQKGLPIVEEEAPFSNTCMSRRDQIPWSWISRRLKPGMTVLAKPSSN
jgi:hypothetical protein